MDLSKIHIFIDTSILSQYPKRDNAAFVTIARLASTKDVVVHLSDVSVREFTSQEEGHFKTGIEEIRKALKNLQRRIPSDQSVLTEIGSILTSTDSVEKQLITLAQTSLQNWLRAAGAEICTPKSDHSDRVLAAYFQGTLPFKNKKSRDDFPDAFILAALQDLLAVHKSLHAVIADKRLRDSAAALTGVMTYGGLDEFVQSSTCQESILAVNVRQNMDQLRCYLRSNHSVLDHHITEHLEYAINGRDVVSTLFTEDNNTATITSVYEPKEIQCETDRAEYYGEGVIVVPFSSEAEVLVDYCIFKGDYYALDDDSVRRIHISDSDWNDHYMAVQEYFIAHVSGTISFSIEESLLTKETFDADGMAAAVANAEGTIDEICEVEITR